MATIQGENNPTPEKKRHHRHRPQPTVSEDILEIEKAPRKEEIVVPKTPEEIKKEEQKKKYKQMGILAILGLLFILFLPTMYKGLIQARSDTKLDQNEMVMSDLTGYNEADAIKLLEQNDLIPSVFYTYDQYSSNGTVIKTNIQPGTIVTKGTQILLYICDDSTPFKDVDYSLIETPPTPFVKDKIDVVGFDIMDDKFNILIQNNNNICITTIEYEIVYENEYRENIGGRTYQISDIQILPGDKYLIEETIQEPLAHYMTVANFRYKTIPVPDNPR